MTRTVSIAAACGLLALSASGCGSSGSSSSSSSSSQSSGAPAGSAPAGGGAASGAGALSAEATSAATGDIPDSQVFLTYRDPSGYSISYPEGWTRKGGGAQVTFSAHNNIVHIVIDRAGAPSQAALQAELTRLRERNPTLTFASPTTVQLKTGSAVKATYRTQSSPNSVTGKRVLLIVDRYEFAKAGRRATIDLGTPQGVDNIDAYRKIVNSFRWQ